MLPRDWLLLPIVLSAAWPASAAMLSVTTALDENNAFADNGNCALREAIEAANTDAAVDACPAGSGADVILLPAGTYSLSLPGSGEDANQTGDLDVTESLTIEGVGPDASAIEGGWASDGDRLLHVQCDGATPAVVDFTLRGVRLTGGGALNERSGGGLLVEDCSEVVNATLEHVEVADNAAGYDGGLPGSPLAGGGIAVDSAGQFTLRDSLVADNDFAVVDEITGSLGGAGLGMTGGGGLLVERSRFTANETFLLFGSAGTNPSGGALWTDSFTTIRDTTFDANRVDGSAGRGGGIYCESTLMTVENSTFSENRALYGGAFGNGLGGAPGCIVVFDSVTVTSNRAQGGGLFNAGGGIGVVNSIIAGNTLGGSPDDVAGTFTSNDYNLIGAVDGSTGFTGPNDLTGTAASPINPLLAALGSDGFRVPTRPPVAGSPALDSGGGTALASDQRGLPRGALGFAPERGAAEVIDAEHGLYLDVGSFGGTPSSGYGAAAVEPGLWNSQNLGLAGALDRDGSDSGVEVEIGGEGLIGISSGATDPARLFLDGASDCTHPEAWSVGFENLPALEYVVLVYAPHHTGYSTGDLLVDGAPLDSLPGDTFELAAGQSFGAALASTPDGSLVVSGSDGPGIDCAGISGIQLLPEPERLAGLAGSIVTLAWLTRLRRGRRPGPRSSPLVSTAHFRISDRAPTTRMS